MNCHCLDCGCISPADSMLCTSCGSSNGQDFVDEGPVLIRRNKDPYGWMGNMSRYPVTFGRPPGWVSLEYRTTEALFQCLRFDDGGIRELIHLEKSPMAAKLVAKKHKDKMSVKPQSKNDVDQMELCLWLKINQHIELGTELIKTGNREIIEDCTKRQRGSGLFWGAALVDKKWVGENQLGKLWMEIRNTINPMREKQP